MDYNTGPVSHFDDCHRCFFMEKKDFLTNAPGENPGVFSCVEISIITKK